MNFVLVHLTDGLISSVTSHSFLSLAEKHALDTLSEIYSFDYQDTDNTNERSEKFRQLLRAIRVCGGDIQIYRNRVDSGKGEFLLLQESKKE